MDEAQCGAAIPDYASGQRSLVPTRSNPTLRLVCGRYGPIDIGNHPVDVLPREPMKVVQALRNAHHDRQFVAPSAPLEREQGPPATERDPRPSALVPTQDKHIRRIPTHHAIQIAWTHDTDPHAHRAG